MKARQANNLLVSFLLLMSTLLVCLSMAFLFAPSAGIYQIFANSPVAVALLGFCGALGTGFRPADIVCGLDLFADWAGGLRPGTPILIFAVSLFAVNTISLVFHVFDSARWVLGDRDNIPFRD